MPYRPKSILNAYIEMSPIADSRTHRFHFIYPRVERKSALVEQVILYDSVYIVTSHFRELEWLSSWIPFALLEDLLLTEALKFVFNPWLILNPGTEFPPNQLSAAIMLDVCGLPSTIPDKLIE